MLDVDGKMNGSSPMSPPQVLEALRLMLLSRAVDERLIKLQRMGRVGVYGPVHGQEAAVIGSAMALDPQRDWMVPASREHPAMLRHGLPLKNMFATYMGNFDAASIPDGVRLLPRQQSIGAQLPHAAGLAWALKLREIRGVVAVYFGEGASSEGDFHEASNLAGVMRVPLVMLLINNHYAISTPTSRQTAARSLARRAEGYGFPGFEVDGNDLLAVYATTLEAVNRALAGEGPTLIECRTYRMGFHNTSDNPKEYREPSEVAEAERRDPIERVRRYATAEGLWSGEQEARTMDEIRAEIDAAQAQVEELPRPGAASIFKHVYAALSPRLEQQRDAAVDEAT
ncbi:MAG TPA: thiamine pyrophosphate-dependent enzyme [Candidatus Dormibacteraeota bacterium]|nr:thiamine pyrophosphate-dependent enzyme [Candidatus Dormibacteraeota bacterium]